MPAELYFVTPADLLVTYLVGLALVLVAVGLSVWLLRPPPARPARPRQVDPPESARTVELPRGHVGGPRTGTLHGPVHRPDVEDMPTAFIEAVRR